MGRMSRSGRRIYWHCEWGGIGVLSYLMAWLGMRDYRPEWVFSLEFLGGAGVPECR